MKNKPRIILFPISQQILFAKRLALYLDSGIPILEGLHLLISDTQNTTHLYIYRGIERSVANGQPLSFAMSLFPHCFSPLTIGFIQAGESTGSLASILEKVSVLLRKRNQVRTKVLGALLYPAIVFSSTILMALFLTLFIFPKIIPVLTSFKTRLPFTTKILISTYDVLQHDWLLILFLLLFSAVVLFLASRNDTFRTIQERALLGIPVFSKLYQYYILTSLLYTLSIQLKSGVRILSAISLTQNSVPGSTYPKALAAIEERVSKGKRLSDALIEFPYLFPTLVSQMVCAGEMTGTLAVNLESLSEEYESQLDEVTKNLTVLVEPILMMCMGFLVGLVALAIITPIYAITQNLT